MAFRHPIENINMVFLVLVFSDICVVEISNACINKCTVTYNNSIKFNSLLTKMVKWAFTYFVTYQSSPQRERKTKTKTNKENERTL